MFSELNTKDIINERMLSRIPNKVDKSEGSFTADITQTTASEMEQGYIELDTVLNLVFASTSEGESLEKRVSEFGIDRRQGKKATSTITVTGSDGTFIPEGTVFTTLDGLKFITTESATISEGIVDIGIEGEFEGTAYNIPAETIVVNFNNVNGIESVINQKPITDGADVESDAELLQRFQIKTRLPANSGNIHQYKLWALEVIGIGDAKAIPTWDISENRPFGEGSVKVICINNDRRGISEEKAQEVYEYIETVRPVGADVTVVSAEEKVLNVSVSIMKNEYGDTTTITDTLKKSITDYLKSISFSQSYASHAIIGGLVLDIENVTDYAQLQLNGKGGNYEFSPLEVVVLGEVAIEWL